MGSAGNAFFQKANNMMVANKPVITAMKQVITETILNLAAWPTNTE